MYYYIFILGLGDPVVPVIPLLKNKLQKYSKKTYIFIRLLDRKPSNLVKTQPCGFPPAVFIS